MKKRTLFCMCFCVIIAFFAFDTQAKANLPVAVSPWEVTFKAANMVFYMTPPKLPPQGQLDFFHYPEISEERMQIETGLYYDENPLRNIYYVDIVAHRSHVIISACGSYIAAIQNTIDNYDGEVVGGGLVNFFDNGRLVKSYGVDDIIDTPSMLHKTSAGVFWMAGGGSALDHNAAFNPETNELTLETYEHRVLVFDITTGEIIQEDPNVQAKQEDSHTFMYVAIGVGIVICGIGLLVMRRCIYLGTAMRA